MRVKVEGLELVSEDGSLEVYIDKDGDFVVECPDCSAWTYFPAELVEQLVINWRNKQAMEKL